MGINDLDIKKWDWELDDKTQSIYKNLCFQIERVFDHKRECSYKTRERYEDGVKHFAKYVAEVYKKQNLNTIKPMHLYGYVECMQEVGYSPSYITTNLSAIRYFCDALGKDSKRLPSNRQLEVNARGIQERIGPDRAWSEIEIAGFVRYARQVGQDRYADMISLSALLGFRIHEICRLEKRHLEQALKDRCISIKGKGGLVRDVPVDDLSLIKELYDRTPKNSKVFVMNNEKTHLLIKRLQVFIYNHQNNFAIGDHQLTFHGLRHFYAAEKFKHFRSVGYGEYEAKKKVAMLLGHHRVEVVDIYLLSKKN